MWAPIVHFAILATSLGNMNQTPKDILGSIDSVMTQSREPAVRALDSFRKLVNEQNYRAMGFDSVSEVRSATLGQPLVEFHVRLDKLREYRPGGNPVSLLDGGDKVIYPVLVGQLVRSSIVLAKDSSGWATASYGGPNATKLLYRTKAAAGGGQYFAVTRRCRHLYADLAGGRIDREGCLVCPWHGSKYDVSTGRMVRGPQCSDRNSLRGRRKV